MKVSGFLLLVESTKQRLSRCKGGVYFDAYDAELSVTDPQNRALREFLAASDESFNLQGYAGGLGKPT